MKAANTTEELLGIAERVVRRVGELGGDHISVTVSNGTHVTIARRDGRVEQATEATTRGLVLSLLDDDRYSSHSTSDLRPEALDVFLRQAVAATRHLERDPDRRLPDGKLCGTGASAELLDQDDPAWYRRTAEERNYASESIWKALDARRPKQTISAATWTADGQSDVVRVMSNGFSGSHRGCWYTVGGEITLQDENGRRPEASTHFSTRHIGDLPLDELIADDLVARGIERLGSSPAASGRYPLILLNRAASRLLSVLGGPLSGSSIHEGRSCLADRLGTKIGSEALTLLDDPLIPRGLGSRPWDSDGLVATKRPIVENGILRSFYVSVYYGRKLGIPPTTGSRSNWVVPAGTRSWQEIAKPWPKAILVDAFLGGNSNPVTGDFSYGIRGAWIEHGQRVRAVSEMNLSGNLLELWHNMVAVGNDPWPWTSVQAPTLVFEDMQFSGS